MFQTEIEEITYQEFLDFCDIWNIEPRDKDEDWVSQYIDNIEYMRSGEGYPTGMR